jgi:uncharacterized protein YciI
MNHYVVLLPMLDEAKNQKHRPKHLAYLEDLEKRSKIFLKARFVDGSGGMIIYKADSLEEAEVLAMNDPFVIEGARSCEIHELLIV